MSAVTCECRCGCRRRLSHFLGQGRAFIEKVQCRICRNGVGSGCCLYSKSPTDYGDREGTCHACHEQITAGIQRRKRNLKSRVHPGTGAVLTWDDYLHANLGLDYDALEASWQELPLAEAPRLREIERTTRDEDEHMRDEGCGTQGTSGAQATENCLTEPGHGRTLHPASSIGGEMMPIGSGLLALEAGQGKAPQ